MKYSVVFDTNISSHNLGNEIIMDYSKKHLTDIFPEHYFFYLSTHDILTRHSIGIYRRSKYNIIGGTNLLSSNMGKHKQWYLSPLDFCFLRNVILMGVGWRQYEGKVDFYTKKLLRKVLSKNMLLSVRDSHTEERLRSIGFNNVINTCCQSTWNLTPSFCSSIPRKKASKVITTVTDYNKNEKIDRIMLEVLCRNYDIVYLWPQSFLDDSYVASFFDCSKIVILPPTLQAYDKVLSEEDVEYVGTRLHGGIRALNHKKRSLIIGIDNRAIEMAKDINLNILRREDVRNDLEDRINSDFFQDIKIPQKAIQMWKRQFSL